MNENDLEVGEFHHEEALQALLVQLLTDQDTDLDDVCRTAGIPTLVDGHDQPVHVTGAHTYRDAGVLSYDRGVVVDLSDGSQFQVTIIAARLPHH